MSEQPPGQAGQQEPGQHGSGRPGPGSVEEEAHRLVRAAAEWWQAREEQAAPGRGAATATAEQPGAGHEPGAPCTGCPWCRAKSALGPVGAETALGLADLLGSAADSLRAYARSQGAGGPHEPPAPEEDGGRGDAQPEPPGGRS